MPYELIITEKPSSAKKIAMALANGKAQQEKSGNVVDFKLTHGSRDIVVACAAGHLYSLAEKNSNGWKYPVFDVEWKPAAEVGKDSKFTKKYLDTIKKLGKGADEVTIATDYDIEGEVIGHNILVLGLKRKDANRMKFSTLTKPDLIKAYDNKSPRIDWGQANAGLTRHVLDWFYGINLSRALTTSVKKAGSFKMLSSGRVQGPALKIIVDKEKEISAFKPDPYWQLRLTGKAKDADIEAFHEKDKFWKEEESKKILDKVSGKPANVSDVTRKQFNQAPPVPFDLTALQMESYKSLRIQPKITLQLAQDLYSSGLISYPRTSSQILPPEIDIKGILAEIAKQDYYKVQCEALLATDCTPNNGKKTDPAHPAIYPTGLIASISGDKARLYDLIVRRFMATLGQPAVRETMEVSINIEGERFVTRGTRTVEKGWHEYYGPHLKQEEEQLPAVVKGDSINNPQVDELAKETQPPKRYTAASIIKELEKRNLGTKATRAHIVDTLFRRGYVKDQSIQATELGIMTVETLEKYSPTILDEELTRSFELEMEEIQEGKKKPAEVLDKAKKLLTDILANFKKKEKVLGEELKEANIKAQDEMNYIGKCTKCKDGNLSIKRSKYGKFVGCTNYPDCTQTYKLPGGALVKTADKICETCGGPMVLLIRRGKKPLESCLNSDCQSKSANGNGIEALEKIAAEKACPKCSSKLVVRKSIYGNFIGCSTYPKCRYTENSG